MTNSTQRGNTVIIVGLALVNLVVYGAALSSSLVEWDDPRSIFENPHLGLGWEQLQWMFTDTAYVRRYMPLGWVSYSVDRVFFHGSSLSYHAGNLLLHVANTWLVYVLLKRLLMRAVSAPSSGTLVQRCAGLGALWWAVNPLRVEEVAWASARIYCVATLFLLLAVLAYLKAHDRPAVPAEEAAGDAGPPVNRRCLWLAVLFYGCSLLTYPIAAGGLAVFVMLDFYPLRRLPADFRQWLTPAARAVAWEKLPFLLPMAMMLGITLAARLKYTEIDALAPLDKFGIGPRIAQAFYVWGYYVWKPWLPFHLAPLYDTLLEFNPASAPFIASAVLVLALTALLVWRARQWPAVLAVWIGYLALLFPLLGFTEHPHYTYDRYSILPGLGWAVLVAGAAWKLKERRGKNILLPAALAWLAACGYWSHAQVRVWNNSFAVHARMAESLGNHPLRAGHESALGVLCLRQGNWAGAEDYFRRALRLDPRLPDTWTTLGDALGEQHRNDEAMACYRQALQIQPDYVPAHVNLAIAFATAGNLKAAIPEFEAALKYRPNDPALHQNLAVALRDNGDLAAARQHAETARKLRAQSAPPP